MGLKNQKWMVDAKAASLSVVMSQPQLFTDVDSFVVESGKTATDRGAGSQGWYIGVPFSTLTAAVQYLEQITDRFKKEISKGFLYFELKTWDERSWAD